MPLVFEIYVANFFGVYKRKKMNGHYVLEV